MKAIRAVQVREYIYIPDLVDSAYVDAGILTVEGALTFDQTDYEKGEVTLEELITTKPKITTTWEIIDIGGPENE